MNLTKLANKILNGSYTPGVDDKALIDGIAKLESDRESLHEMLRVKLELIRCGIGANYSGNPYKNKLYTEAADLLEATKD